MADPKFDRYDILVTPKGVAAFPWLTKPDTKFNEEGVYKTGLAFDPEDPAFVKFKKKIEAIHKEAVAAVKESGKKKVTVVSPFRPEEDEEGEPTGRIIINAKSKAKQKYRDGTIQDVTLNIVDAKRNEVPSSTPVYGGSVLRLAVRPAPYFMQGKCGITLYISGVQVIELQSGGGGAADFFDEEEGYETEDVSESPFEDDAEDEDEDDLY
jgi:hypothetical protein